MNNLKTNLLPLLLICFLLSSCKFYLDVEKLKPKVSQELRTGDFDVSSLNKLVEGDRVLLRTIDGKKHNIFFNRINGDQLIGTTIDNGMKQTGIIKDIEFAVSDIEKLWVKRASAAATVPIVLAGSLGLAIVILLIGLALDPISF